MEASGREGNRLRVLVPHMLLKGFLWAFLTSSSKYPHSQMRELRLALVAQIIETRMCFCLDLSMSAFVL